MMATKAKPNHINSFTCFTVPHSEQYARLQDYAIYIYGTFTLLSAQFEYVSHFVGKCFGRCFISSSSPFSSPFSLSLHLLRMHDIGHNIPFSSPYSVYNSFSFVLSYVLIYSCTYYYHHHRTSKSIRKNDFIHVNKT